MNFEKRLGKQVFKNHNIAIRFNLLQVLSIPASFGIYCVIHTFF